MYISTVSMFNTVGTKFTMLDTVNALNIVVVAVIVGVSRCQRNLVVPAAG